MTNKKYKIKVNPYNSTLYLVLTENVYLTAKRIAKKIDTSISETDDGGVAYFLAPTSPEASGYYIVCSPKIKEEDIVHEVSHCTFEVMRDHGVQLTEESEEAYVYLIDYLFAEVKKRVQKVNKVKEEISAVETNSSSEERVL